MGYGLRKPLVGRSGQVAAFELLLPAAAQRHLGGRGDPVAQAAHQTALLWAAKFIGAAGRPALVQVPAALLERPGVSAAAPAGALIWVPDLPVLSPEVAKSLRARGVLLGRSDGPPVREPAIDFLVLNVPAGEVDNAIVSAQRWREVWPQLRVVALGLQHLDDVERVLKGGINLAGGQLGRSAEPTAPRELGSAAHRICELLNHLALDRDTAVIAQAVRLDVALSYRLLRYVNSPAIGMARSIETVDQAVTVLGRTEMYRWLSVQLLACGAVRQASRAMQESALARGKLLEAVALARGDADAGAHFTLGLLSMIEPLLQVPLAAALEPLRLSETSREALLRRAGDWADRLALLDAIDSAEGARIDALAERLGVAEALAEMLDAAWQWSAAATETAGEPAVSRAGW
jgi:EAL and modified HD-GYP domain-containing signal transduction protein